MTRLRVLLPLLALLAAPAVAASGPDFPALSGRVVDAADILPPAEENALTAKLAALEAQTGNQLVIATIPDLQGYVIEDYGYQLGRAWGLGQTKINNGAMLLIAPRERKVRIEVGYGLEPVLTDALSSIIVQQRILPAFRAGDLPGGIADGADAIIEQLGLPPDQAAAIAAQAAEQPREGGEADGPGIGGFIWFIILLVWIILAGSRRGRRRGLGGLGWFILGSLLNSGGRGGGGGNWGGGGGFSGGGGSFGGGGSSGGW